MHVQGPSSGGPGPGRGRRRHVLARCASLLATLALSAASAFAAAPVPPGAVGPRAPLPHARRRELAAPGTLTVKALPPPPRGHVPRGVAIFRPRHPGAYERSKHGGVPAAPVATTTLAPESSLAGGGSTSGGGAGPTDALMSLDTQVSLLGNDQYLVPPDTQLAAGPSYLVEFDNATGSVWTKSGSLVQAFDLNNFFGVPSVDAGAGAFDVQVLYDAASGRWFASASATDPTNTYNQVFLAVSATSDPTGSWYVYTVEADSYGELYDQPMLGVSSDKVILSWNDFAYGSFMGQETWVLQKSDLLAGGAVGGVDFGPDAWRFRLVPARNLSAGDTAWLVYNNSDGTNLVQNTSYPSLGVVAINGTPDQGDVSWTEWDPAISPTSVPPNAQQPGGAMPITTDDDRLQSAVWQNGVLWTSGNDACVPAGGAATQACLRLIEVSTAGANPAVVQDFDAGAAGTDFYYPAVGLDAAGNLFVAFSYSSPETYASVGATGQASGAPDGALQPLVTVAAGQGVYCGFDCSGGYGTNRWGDYSAASQDPATPSEVWVAGEYAGSAVDQGDWGTAGEALTISGA